MSKDNLELETSFLTKEDFQKPLVLTPEEEAEYNRIAQMLVADIEAKRKELSENK